MGAVSNGEQSFQKATEIFSKNKDAFLRRIYMDVSQSKQTT